MAEEISLQDAERRVFTSTLHDGLWDIALGSWLLVPALVPPLCQAMGPGSGNLVWLGLATLWLLLYVITWWVKKTVVIPRRGLVKFGPATKARLFRFNIAGGAAAVVFMSVIVVLGNCGRMLPAWLPTALFEGIVLVVFGITACFLRIRRLYLYGLLILLAPWVGLWLDAHARLPHRSYHPVPIGFVGGVITLAGLLMFVRFLVSHQLPTDEVSTGEGCA